MAAVVAVLVVRTQHGYYRVARDRLRRAEAAPAGWRTDTTSTLGGRERVASVNQLVYLLLVASRSPTRLEHY